MQFDRAMSLLLAGIAVRRASWKDDSSSLYGQPIRYLEFAHGQAVMVTKFARLDGVEVPGFKMAILTGEDIVADDWEVASPATPALDGKASHPTSEASQP